MNQSPLWKSILTFLVACLTLVAGAVVASPAQAVTRTGTQISNTYYHPEDHKALLKHLGGVHSSWLTMPESYRLKNMKSDRTGHLQVKRADGTWANTNTIYWKRDANNNATAVFRTPSTGPHMETRTYRLYINRTTWEYAWASNEVKITHHNPRYYTDQRKNEYAEMKQYCPNIVLVEEDNLRSYAYTNSLKVNVATRPAGNLLKYAALHECAHLIQFRNYYFDNATLQSKLNAIYGTTGSQGLEQAADCMAFKMGVNPDLIFGTYTKNCSGARGTAADTLLAKKKL